MLLALGPTLLDTQVRAVVIGVVDDASQAAIERASAGADGLWLRSATPDGVERARRSSGLPVGATVDDLAALEELVAAGAAGVECPAQDAAELASSSGLVLWCTPRQADGARAAGVTDSKLVVEGRTGATIEGEGPPAWGAVVRAVGTGAGVVRTTDVPAVRRVVTVTDRLRAARARRGAPA